jgi:hypothetical protein
MTGTLDRETRACESQGAFVGQQLLALDFIEEKGSYQSTRANQEPKTAAVSHAIDE